MIRNYHAGIKANFHIHVFIIHDPHGLNVKSHENSPALIRIN